MTRRLALLCLRRSDGQKLWELPVPTSAVREYANFKNGYATPTPVTDGLRVYASFGAQGVVAADLDDKKSPWRFEPAWGFSFLGKQAEAEVRAFSSTKR